MRCPNCGAEVGESPFCTNCGADLTGPVRSRRRLLRNVDRGVRHGGAAVITFVAVLSVLVVILSAIPASAPGPASPPWTPSDDALVTDDGFIELSGGFEDGTFSATLERNPTTGAEYVEIVLESGLAEGCTSFLWDMREESTATSYMVTKETPVLDWIDLEFGTWEVTVYCESESGERVYTGTLTYRGDVDRQYTWTYRGATMTVTFRMSLEDYILQSGPDQARTVDSLEAASRFVDAGAVKSLEALIWDGYSSVFGGSRDADYAGCLIAMVSSCIECRSDLVTYGESVRWCRPGETLYTGYGDSGDMAVLAASLLKAAGFDTAVVRLPGTWAVGVVADTQEDRAGYSALTIPLDGRDYAICDVVSFAGVGQMPDVYGYDGSILYCGVPVSGGYGVRAV